MKTKSSITPSPDSPRAADRTCPACGGSRAFRHVEDHLDRTSGTAYRLFTCPDCGVVFSEPRKAVGADWYEKAVPQELPVSPQKDRRFRLFFRDRLPVGKILDVGCGEGGFLELAQKHGYTSCTGFDYDRRQTDKTRLKGIPVSTQSWESFCKEQKDSAFDIVTLFDVLEHTPEPAAMIETVRRLLKPGGHAVITLPNAKRPLPFGREEWDYPPHHFTRWTPEAMKRFLERHGFTVLHQDASALEMRYFLDVMAMHGIMKPLLRLTKGLLFGKTGQPAAGVTELYERNGASASRSGWKKVFADKRLRTSLFTLLKSSIKIALWPIAAGTTLVYRIRRGDAGQGLYTLARKTNAA